VLFDLEPGARDRRCARVAARRAPTFYARATS
jgi:hypothetical protein